MINFSVPAFEFLTWVQSKSVELSYFLFSGLEALSKSLYIGRTISSLITCYKCYFHCMYITVKVRCIL